MQSREPLSTRDDEATRRDIVTRAFSVRAESVNEEERSVEATISTEAPVQVYDWRREAVIDEVLLMSGAQIPAQMPMLANHSRWSLDDVLGSIRNLRVEGESLIGKLFFARSDQAADKAWNKVQQRHISDVSVGYRVNAATEIRPGESAAIAGRTFTAGTRTLRVVTSWTPKEGSLVPIGADQFAKIREDFRSVSNHFTQEESIVDPKLRAYLESIGLRKDATEDEAKTYLAGLTGDQKARAEAITRGDATPANPPAPPAAPVAAPEAGRAAPAAAPAAPPAAPVSDVEAERSRVREIMDLAESDVPQTLVRQAVAENWTVARASREFLSHVRGSRSTPVGPAIHSHSREGDTNARTLAASLAMVHGGLDRTRVVGLPYTNGRSAPGQPLAEQEVEAARRLGAMSAIDFCRLCAQADGGRFHMDPTEAIRAAVSGGTLAYVFSTSAYAKLNEGWAEIIDTTDWCDEEDIPNFLTHDDISITASAAMEQLPRGDTAKHASLSDGREQYKLARYAKQLVVDEQDIIDDRLGAILRMPSAMGAATARLRPDLVYAILLENAALADTGALFNNTAGTTAGGHANLTTAVLGSTGLKAGIGAMGVYREGGAVLQIRPRYLIVPEALRFTAMELLQSALQAYTAAAAAATPSNYMTINMLAAENLALRIDDRIGAGGVTDPRSKTARTGLDTNWFLAAGGSRGVRVAYRSGTGRRPVMRSFVLDKGQWGLGWDINMDIGAKALDYRGMHKSTGAG
jgi:hypothetical protein